MQIRLCTLALLLFLTTDSICQLTFSARTEISRSSSEVGVADFDHDGHVDIAIAGASQRWYRGPDFVDFYTIGTSDGGPYAARVADMNGDGWADFVTSDGTRNADDMPGFIYLYLNPGDSLSTYDEWERIIIYEGAVRHQNDLRIVDMDNDGLLDVIERTWSSERVVVAFQNSDIENWTVRAFDTGETGKPEGISAGDLDGDGYNEIVLSGVYWAADDWRTSTPTEHLVDQLYIQGKVKSAVGDIDNDGDQDIYMGSCEGPYIDLSWYENTGTDSNGSVTFTKHIIKPNTGKYHMVELIDIDFDGDLDLATGKSFGDDGSVIFYNNNNGTSWTEDVYDPAGNLYTGIVADLDADGDYDVVGPSGFYDKVYYYINETPGDIPNAPTDASVTLVDGLNADLSWTDNSADEGVFEVERLSNGNWSQIAILSANMTSYIDDSTLPNTSYQYRIRAGNVAGVSAWDSTSVVTTWTQLSAVTFTPTGGNYVDPVTVSLESIDADAEIRYTTDGSLPTPQSPLYEQALTVTASTTLSARSYAAMSIPSETIEHIYNIAVNGNFPPIANAGLDITVTDTLPINLNGNESSDLDDSNSDLVFTWSQIAGPAVVISNADSSICTFTPTQEGIYEFALEVADEVESDRDSVSITVQLVDGLIAHWPIDEATGTAISDIVGDLDGTLEAGASLAPAAGKVDGAVLISGTNGMISCPPLASEGDAISVTLWINMQDANNTEGRFISQASGTSASQHDLMIGQINTSALRFRLRTSNGGTETLASSTNQINVGEWTFVTAVYDGTEMRLYRNATEIATTNKSGVLDFVSASLAIGNQPSGAGSRAFSGYIDDVQIYDRALSLEDIQLIYENSCSNHVAVSDLTIDDELEIYAKQSIQLDNVNLTSTGSLYLQAPQVTVQTNCQVTDGTLTIATGSGCN